MKLKRQAFPQKLLEHYMHVKLSSIINLFINEVNTTETLSPELISWLRKECFLTCLVDPHSKALLYIELYFIKSKDETMKITETAYRICSFFTGHNWKTTRYFWDASVYIWTVSSGFYLAETSPKYCNVFNFIYTIEKVQNLVGFIML